MDNNTKTQDRLSMVFHPLQGDKTHLTMSSFTTSMDALRKVAGKFHCKDLRIISLSSNSPVSLTIEDAAAEIDSLGILFKGLNDFSTNREIPSSWNRSVIDGVMELLAPIGRSIGRFSVSSAKGENIEIDTKYKVDFQNKIEVDYSAFGTTDGMLEAVNIHGKKNTLTLYPSIGNNKIVCEFEDQYLGKVKELIGSYVEISGEMVYRWRDKYPYSGVVDKIDAINEDDLPNFSDLYGMAKNATHGVAAEEFIAKVRSEWS